MKLQKTLKSSTIRLHFVSIRGFLEFLRYRGINTTNTKEVNINFLRTKTLPSFLNDSQYKDFMREIENLKEHSLIDMRMKLIILIATYTGIRSREVARITLNDISHDDEEFYKIHVKGKCLSHRLVSIRKKYIESLLYKYLERRKELSKDKSIYIFQCRNIDNPPQITIDLKPILARINAVQERGNHLRLLRRSYASFVYRESRDIVLTQQVLGHSNISATQIYVHINTDAYKKAASFF